MVKEYKRKFLVEGDTIKDCWNFRKKCDKKFGNKKPCQKENAWSRDESKCPFRINKPNQYIVSETLKGEWQCSCPVWKFRREVCHHIRKAKTNPKKYEIAKEHTGKTVNVFTSLFEGDEQ